MKKLSVQKLGASKSYFGLSFPIGPLRNSWVWPKLWHFLSYRGGVDAISGLVRNRGARTQDAAPLDQLNKILHEFNLRIANPADSLTHGAGAALDLLVTLGPPVILQGDHPL